MAIVGDLEDWEQQALEEWKPVHAQHFAYLCQYLARDHHNFERMKKWAEVGAVSRREPLIAVHAALLYGCNLNLEYKGDEAALWLSTLKDGDLVEWFCGFDANGSRSTRYLIRTLLCGSLEKNNRSSSLYHSFFRSSLREVYLLPLIAKYLIPEKCGVRGMNKELEMRGRHVKIESFVGAARYIFAQKPDAFSITIRTSIFDCIGLSIIPLVLSSSPALRTLQLRGPPITTISPYDEFDISYFLVKSDTLRVKHLFFSNLDITSFPHFSQCDFSSLQALELGSSYDPVTGFQSLEGLTSNHTACLKTFTINCPDLEDISALSNCNLSSLETLRLYNTKVSNLSALRHVPSLKKLVVEGSKISDLSPLLECKEMALEQLRLSACPIKNISPLSRMNLSRLSRPIDLGATKVSDLSALEDITVEGIVVDISNTKAKKKFVRVRPPHRVGKVAIQFDWL